MCLPITSFLEKVAAKATLYSLIAGVVNSVFMTLEALVPRESRVASFAGAWVYVLTLDRLCTLAVLYVRGYTLVCNLGNIVILFAWCIFFIFIWEVQP
jgi:hypothetical protein